MSSKIIDFNKSKQKLINKMYPNVSPIAPTSKIPSFVKTTESFNKFKKIFDEYETSLFDDKLNGKISLDEVLVYFNRFFDDAYGELSQAYDLEKISEFKEALDYSVISNGKRLRPFLIFVTYNFCLGTNYLSIIPFMVAIELIHTFSLIHDDLPCMDNDELRRGKPTVWKKYGEDIAVLAGDALLLEAATILFETVFELIYSELGTYAVTSAFLLFKLSGLDGMITGQVFDVQNENNDKLTLDDIIYMYDKKTTALLTAAIVIGANMSAKYPSNIELIEKLGIALGESYQIKDDLLEIEGTTEKIGKSVDSDKKNGKMTYVRKVGVEESKKRLEVLHTSCLEIINLMANENNQKEAKLFKDVINHILARER